MSLTTFALLPTTDELQSYKIIAEVASNNPHWRKVGGNGTPETIVATILSVMLLARELGISPIQAISGGINNIQGKFEISARLMNQLIRRHGHKVEVSLLNDEVCKIWGQRKDTREEMEVTYHIEEARRSGLVKDGGAWKKTPQDMLFARAISRLARRLYPDCIGGCYVEGELQETIQGKVMSSIEVPNKDELGLHFDQKDMKLPLPSDVSEDKVNIFLEEISQQTKKPVSEIKKTAATRLEPFLEKFRQWEYKKYSIEDKKEEIAV